MLRDFHEHYLSAVVYVEKLCFNYKYKSTIKSIIKSYMLPRIDYYLS